MNDVEDQLAGAFERLAERAPHHPDLAGVAVRRVRRRRKSWATGIGAGAAALAVSGTLLSANGVFDGSNSGSDAAAVGVVPACAGTVTSGVLPEWARTGFSDPKPVMPFARSGSGNVVAILFGGAITAPPREGVANKVLWVWQRLPDDPTSIKVTARLDGTGPAVTAGLPMPTGPSYVDLPAPGCWRLTLSWSGGSDTIDLPVLRPEDAATS